MLKHMSFTQRLLKVYLLPVTECKLYKSILNPYIFLEKPYNFL